MVRTRAEWRKRPQNMAVMQLSVLTMAGSALAEQGADAEPKASSDSHAIGRTKCGTGRRERATPGREQALEAQTKQLAYYF